MKKVVYSITKLANIVFAILKSNEPYKVILPE